MDRFVPFGGEQHVVRTDSKICGYVPNLFGSVVFRSREELDALIRGLTALRDGWNQPSGHIHLQDYGMAPGGDPTQLEVTFCTPAWADAQSQHEIRNDLIDDARTVLVASGISSGRIGMVLGQLARGPQFVRQLIYEVPPELRKQRPAPGVWSAHEHAVHLLPVHPIMMARLEQMLRDPTQELRSYEPSRDEPDDALLKLDLDTEMDRLERERGAMIERLKELTSDQWAITAPHEEYSHYSVYIMFRHLAMHDLYHAYRIEERLLRKEWA